MSAKVLLAILAHNGASGAVLETACKLASHWTSRLNVIFPFPPIWEEDVLSMADFSSESYALLIGEQAKKREQEVVERKRFEFEESCRRVGLRISSDDSVKRPCAHFYALHGGSHGSRILARARLADLVIMQRPHTGIGENYEGMINLILRESGRLLMIAPPVATETKCAHVAIAWNGSAESARAVGATVNLLSTAESVDVLTAESERTGASAAQDLTAYLACHDITAKSHVFPKHGSRSVGESILEKCREFGADLLIMGAYTHSRWREMVFGGVTRHVMGHADLPVMMVH